MLKLAGQSALLLPSRQVLVILTVQLKLKSCRIRLTKVGVVPPKLQFLVMMSTKVELFHQNANHFTLYCSFFSVLVESSNVTIILVFFFKLMLFCVGRGIIILWFMLILVFINYLQMFPILLSSLVC